MSAPLPTSELTSSDAGHSFAASGGSVSRSNYKTILADPPWEHKMVNKWKTNGSRNNHALPYPTMKLEEICKLPIGELAAPGAHLWLWTTNEYLEAGFQVMRAWGFKYLAPVTWVKPSGIGAWFIHRTQTLLFGYRSPLVMRERYKPTVLLAGNPEAHSAKPQESYELIEAVSQSPRIEIFARPWTPMFPRRDGWDVCGNEVPQDVVLGTQNS